MHGLCFICVSVNVQNNASADKHMAAVRQDTISNISLCVHPPLLIPLYPSFPFLFLSSQSFPIFLLCSALFCTPNSVSPSCPPSYPPSFLNLCIREFSVSSRGPEGRDLPLGENKGTQCIAALFVVLSFARWINTPASICLSSFLSLSLLSPYFSQPSVWIDWSGTPGSLGHQRGVMNGIVFITDCLCPCRIRVRPSPIP